MNWYEAYGITKPYYSDDAVCIVHADCRDILPLIPDKSIDLVITSPPYGNLRDYSDKMGNLGNYRLPEQVPMLMDITQKIKAVLKDGRRYCLNVMDIHDTDSEGSYLESLLWLLVPKILDLGFRCKEIIIWDKPGSWSKMMPSGTVPYPPSPLMQAFYQYIIVLRKQGKPDYSHITNDIKVASAFRAKDEWSRWASCIWNFRNDKDSKHPAIFPETLPVRLLKLYSFLTEITLDPFLGSGTTAFCAKKLGRKCIGIEIEEKYCKIAAKRCSQMILPLEVK